MVKVEITMSLIGVRNEHARESRLGVRELDHDALPRLADQRGVGLERETCPERMSRCPGHAVGTVRQVHGPAAGGVRGINRRLNCRPIVSDAVAYRIVRGVLNVVDRRYVRHGTRRASRPASRGRNETTANETAERLAHGVLQSSIGANFATTAPTLGVPHRHSRSKMPITFTACTNPCETPAIETSAPSLT